jgi:hypothetical protein
LFHIYSHDGDRNRRIIEVRNGSDSRLLNPPSKTFVTLQAFKEVMFREGNYLFWGTNIHLHKLISYLGPRFPSAVEVANLGWQKDGFFAFADGIFRGNKFQKANEDGIVSIDDQFYFLPAFSRINEHTIESGEDEHEIDRKLVYRPSEANFEKYAEKCERVFGTNGLFGMVWTIAACFRDFLWQEEDAFPLLFLQGQKETGKSQLAWALSDIFFRKHGPFNLNSGTDAGFAGRMENFSNTIAWHDESTNNIDHGRFQGL